MEQSPDNAQALMLIGSFTKKVLEKRKPRPHEIINSQSGKAAEMKNMLSTAGSVKSTPLQTDVAGYIDPYAS
jgi:hypothetical protein